MVNDNVYRECRNCVYFDREKVYCVKGDMDVNPNSRCNRHKTRTEFESLKYRMKDFSITEEQAWLVYEFINEWKDGKYGLIPLSEALDVYFNNGGGE